MAENAPEQLPSVAWHSLPQELQDLARPEAMGKLDCFKGNQVVDTVDGTPANQLRLVV